MVTNEARSVFSSADMGGPFCYIHRTITFVSIPLKYSISKEKWKMCFQMKSARYLNYLETQQKINEEKDNKHAIQMRCINMRLNTN